MGSGCWGVVVMAVGLFGELRSEPVSMEAAAYQAPGKSTGVGCHCLLRCNHHRTEQLYFRHLFQRKEKLTFTEKPVHEYLWKL